MTQLLRKAFIFSRPGEKAKISEVGNQLQSDVQAFQEDVEAQYGVRATEARKIADARVRAMREGRA